MDINIGQLSTDKINEFEELIDLSNEQFDTSHIRRITRCNVVAKVQKYDEMVIIDLCVDFNAVVPCSYTLEDVDYHGKGEENLIFKDEIDEDSLLIPANNVIDLKPFIISLVVASVPLKVVGKNATLPKNGDGYRVLTEDEYFAEKHSKKATSVFDKLDDIDID